MSASTLRVPAIQREHGGIVDNRGHAFCLDCVTGRSVGETQWVEAGSLDGSCDGCGKAFQDCRPLEIHGIAVVEYPGCRIF